ncbi:hypothetical protein ACH4F6_39510 [Streptomyces sp. NPDC017936]|uniref:hypothetical protein n=1 Tax=Streptomyces sp. NPDC017936 TaxID=3365016 RepID=UPI003790EC54
MEVQTGTVCQLYLAPPAGTTLLLSADEKAEIPPPAATQHACVSRMLQEFGLPCAKAPKLCRTDLD